MGLRPGRGTPTSGPVSLTATELGAVVAELARELRGWRIAGVARLEGRDDLLLFLRDDENARRALQIALGSGRARVCTTRRRYAKSEFATGPQLDRLEAFLVDTEVESANAAPGERRATFEFRATQPDTRFFLEVELFGNRGLWALCDAEREILELSRLPNAKDRVLRRGEAYVEPAPPTQPHEEPPNRFEPPFAAAIDAHFTELDRTAEHDADLTHLRTAANRAHKRVADRARGLARQLDAMQRADEIRQNADLLLAYGYGVAPDATRLVAPSPTGEGEIEIELRPGVPIHVQAERLYQRARKYADGRRHTSEQLEAARAEEAALERIRDSLSSDPTAEKLDAARSELETRGAIKPRRVAKPRPQDKLGRQIAREGFRRFVSREGLPIFVGRNNAQNDRLSIHTARGNDLWFHVGRGYAGSHVVVRLAKNQQASLETLLDAGTLAVHFSKVRGAELCEVIYTQAKHVQKPKGLPPGRVIATQTKDIRIKLEPDRLARLLDSTNQR